MTQPDAAELDYSPSADSPDDTVRVFYFKKPTPVEDIQQMATVIRSLTEIRRAFLSNAAGAFVVRGTRKQLDAAKWLVESMDQPSLGFGVNQHQVSDAAGENVLRLFSVPKLGSERELSNFASELRAATQVKRMFSYYPLRVIAVRGTPSQVENAARLIMSARWNRYENMVRPVRFACTAFCSGGQGWRRPFCVYNRRT